MRKLMMAAMTIVAVASMDVLQADDNVPLDTSKVVPLTRFLEAHPLDKQAPLVRAALMKWETDSKDVFDVVCPGVIAPVPDKSIKYSGELLVQYIFGGGAHQLEVPADQGKLMPSQLAGVSSMLRAYTQLLGTDQNARIPRFDALLQDEAAGSLAGKLEPLVIAHCLPKPAGTARFPWTIGMTKAQVSAVDGYGPYRSFKNGDLETYNAVFDGHFANFQFFFRDDRLWRIGIYTFEGTDPAAAAQAWGKLYEGMQRSFGGMETPGNTQPTAADAHSMQAFETTAQALVTAGGKAQMAPLHQPSDGYSFASFSTFEVQGTRFYNVTMYFDAPHAKQ
jgi:hypothetical protein